MIPQLNLLLSSSLLPLCSLSLFIYETPKCLRAAPANEFEDNRRLRYFLPEVMHSFCLTSTDRDYLQRLLPQVSQFYTITEPLNISMFLISHGKMLSCRWREGNVDDILYAYCPDSSGQYAVMQLSTACVMIRLTGYCSDGNILSQFVSFISCLHPVIQQWPPYPYSSKSASDSALSCVSYKNASLYVF